MLSLRKIKKTYIAGDSAVEALRGISIDFRKSEFVSILGPSGCGKTTLLNIIGGLDRYTDGDLYISGRSTKSFSDADWDSYRNHSIGFVFQSYNLIPHQSVLSNVELALTLSGVSKSERRERAACALEKVGLAKEMKKKPNQLSGGQMQRVAIARALVNDPEILLADEPTGALDSETSVQIMDLLREIASDRLVIMVTHNPELAARYSTRTVRLLDGEIVDDTNPYSASLPEETAAKKKKSSKGKYKKTSMSALTALSLSTNNLLTKKARTLMISFAGSIGIIGIALILSLSNGIQVFIDNVQKDTLSSYPIQIASESVDMTSLIETLSGKDSEDDAPEREDGRVYQNTIMYDMMNSMMSSSAKKNNLKPFKEYIESEECGIGDYVSAISYGYDLPLPVYRTDDESITQVNPSTVFDAIYGDSTVSSYYQSMMSSTSSYDVWQEMLPNEDGGINTLITDQYDVVYGSWPSAYNEIMLFIDKHNELNDMVLYSLGLRDTAELDEIMKSVMNGEEITLEDTSWTYEELCSMKLTLILPTDKYQKNPDGTWKDMSENEAYLSYAVEKGIPLKITGIARPNDSATATAMSGSVGYTRALTEYVMNGVNSSDIAVQQSSDEKISADNNPYSSESVIGKAFSEVDVFTGLPFKDGTENENQTESEKASELRNYLASLSESDRAAAYVKIASVPSEVQVNEMIAQYMASFPDRTAIEEAVIGYYSEEAGISSDEISSYLKGLSDEELDEMIKKTLGEEIKKSYAEQTSASLTQMTEGELSAALDVYLDGCGDDTLASIYADIMPDKYSKSSYAENASKLGIVREDSPSSINIYAISFEAKESISDIIDKYNASVKNESDKITYTDYVALMMSSVTTIINAISYVLIAFVAISLVVSSIMIGIITYISVLERTKEIGILRSIGASKRDISRVFNAEAVILGFTAGVIGILVTVLLTIPINAIIRALSGISGISAALPPVAAVVLVLISMFLTFIAGLIPSRIAAKKDPVVALRTE